jgi:hypothetical protein
MTAHSSAQGIASLGRYGDDLIVHMNQEEVQGLQALAKQHGTSLTINPKTGMPEAFKLGGVFKALIPIAAGVMFPGFGASLFGGMQGIGAGILAGAATAALTGGNPLLGGVTGALGGYSGAGLGNSFANLGSTAATTGTNVANVTAQNAATNVVGNTLMGQGATAFTSPFISPFTPAGIAGGAGLGAGTVANAGIVGQGALSNAAGNALTNQAMNASLTGANTVANAGNVAQAAAPTYADKLKSGVEKFFQKETTYTDPVTGKTVTGSGFDAYRASLPTRGGEITGITKDAAGNVISSVETPTKMATNMDVFKKIGMPVGGALLGGVEASDLNPQINLSEQEQKVYEQTGIDSAGKPTFGYIAKSAFNPYRTLNLSGPSPLNLGQSLKLPASTSYATGGTIQSGGIRDLYGTPDNQPTISPGLSGFGLGRLNNLASEQALNQAQTLGYAMGGPVSFADGGNSNKEGEMGLPSLAPDVSMNLTDVAPTNQMQNVVNAVSPTKMSDSSVVAQVTTALRNDPNYQPKNPIEEAIVKQLKGGDTMPQSQGNTKLATSPFQPMAPMYNASQAMTPTYYAGLNAPRGYAEGGETGMNLDELPSLNVNTGAQSYGN